MQQNQRTVAESSAVSSSQLVELKVKQSAGTCFVCPSIRLQVWKWFLHVFSRLSSVPSKCSLESEIRLWLNTKDTKGQPKPMTLNDPSSIKKASFKSGKPVKFITHGFLATYNDSDWKVTKICSSFN